MALPRFVIGGAINSGATYLLYLALLSVMPYIWAYTIAFAAGIALGYLINSIWVFQKAPSYRSAFLYPLTYGVNYLFGVVMLWVLVTLLTVPREFAPLVVLVLSVPLMYMLTRAIFTRGLMERRSSR